MKANNKLVVNLLGCLAILSGVFFMASPIRAQPGNPPTPDFEFSDVTKLTLDPARPSNIFILNKTMLSFTIQLRITDFNFVPLSGQSIGEVITLEDLTGQPLTSILLQPAESKKLVMKTSATELAKIEPGTYTAFLVVDEPAISGKVISRELEIVAQAGKVPTPLVDKWTLQAVRRNPFIDVITCSPACYLPLAVPPGEIVATQGLDSQLGVLVAEKQDPVIVKGSLSTEVKDGVTRLPLVLENLKKPGTYVGTLDLLPNDANAGTVEVTLKTTDPFWWPLATMVVGIILAIWAQYYEAIGRKMFILNSRRHAISPGKIRSKDELNKSRRGKLFLNTWTRFLQVLTPRARRLKSGGQTASPGEGHTVIYAGTKYCESVTGFEKNVHDDEKLKQETKNKFVNYSGFLYKDLDERSQKLIKPINALNFTATPTLDEQNKEYKAVLDELDFIESQLEVWKEFGARWAETYDLIFGFLPPHGEDKPHWPSIQGDVPEFIKTAQKNYSEIEQIKEIKLTDLAMLDDQVKKARILAEGWPALLKKVKEYQGYIQNLYPIEMPKEYKEDLYTADRLLNQAWAELWLARDADDLKERTTKADLDRVEALILGLYRFYITQKQELPRALVSPAGKFQLAGTFQDFLNKIKDRVHPVEDHALMAKRYIRARLTREIFFAVLALGLAGLTGMTSLYFGKSFGSLQDYLGIGTWGLVTKGALEGLNAAVDKLRGFSKA